MNLTILSIFGAAQRSGLEKIALDDLRRRVPRALASVPNHTTLAYFHRCRRKMDLYQEGINYGSSSWKARTAHHKPTNKDEDR